MVRGILIAHIFLWATCRSDGSAIHSDSLLKLDVIEMSLSSELLRGQAELLAKGAGKRFVGTIPGVEGDGENIGGALDECLRRHGEPAGPRVGRQWQFDCGAKRAREMKARHSDAGCDRVKGNVIAEVALYVPDGFARDNS